MRKLGLSSLMKYMRRYYGYIVLAAASCVGASAATVFLTDLLKFIIDSIALENTAQKIFIIAVKMLLIILLGVLSNYLVVRMTGAIGQGVLRDLRDDCIEGLMNASPDYMSSRNYGDIMERVSSDVEGLAEFMQGYFRDCMYVPIMVVVYSIYLIHVNPLLAFFCLLPLVFLVPINVKYMKPIKIRQFEYNKELGLTNNNIKEAFDGAAVIKAYNLQERMEDKYYKALYKTFEISNDTDLRQYNLEPVSRAVQEVPLAVALGIGGLFVFKGMVSIGTLIAYISIIKKLVEPLTLSYQLVVRSQTAIVAINRVFDIIETPPEQYMEDKVIIQDSENPILEFKDVSYKYCTDEENDDKQILNHINFTIYKGMKVAFAGKSGSGKSTILKLIARQIEARDGEIKYYGHSYVDISPKQIRAKEAFISQDTILFPMSVEDNIRVGNPMASKEEIVKAACFAKCDRFIESMHDKLKTVLDEGGNNLSGGQKQRIALARAIVKDAEIYLFDEPTSALDKETEQLICESIEKLPKEKTIITVAHRLSTIKDYDLIYVVDEGRIIEQGGHDELMNSRGAYYQMYHEFCKGEA